MGRGSYRKLCVYGGFDAGLELGSARCVAAAADLRRIARKGVPNGGSVAEATLEQRRKRSEHGSEGRLILKTARETLFARLRSIRVRGRVLALSLGGAAPNCHGAITSPRLARLQHGGEAGRGRGKRHPERDCDPLAAGPCTNVFSAARCAGPTDEAIGHVGETAERVAVIASQLLLRRAGRARSAAAQPAGDYACRGGRVCRRKRRPCLARAPCCGMDGRSRNGSVQQAGWQASARQGVRRVLWGKAPAVSAHAGAPVDSVGPATANTPELGVHVSPRWLIGRSAAPACRLGLLRALSAPARLALLFGHGGGAGAGEMAGAAGLKTRGWKEGRVITAAAGQHVTPGARERGSAWWQRMDGGLCRAKHADTVQLPADLSALASNGTSRVSDPCPPHAMHAVV